MFESARTALIIAPHPDDEVLGAGGTIARLSKAGVATHVAIATSPMAPTFDPAFREQIEEEARAAHQLLGVAQTHYCGFPAAQLDRVSHAEINASLGALFDELQPDTLFIPFVGDLHLDHQLIFLSSLVAARPRHAAAPARILAYETLSETNWMAPGITPSFNANVYVDISTTIDTKIAAFEKYGSQQKPFPDERSTAVIRALAQVRGATIYREAAEAFMLIRSVVSA
jgi:LmbE family N-acetylglucosaminyl deacetylase